MNDIFDSKRIISLVHFIGKHQFVTDLHAKFLCCGAGDHDLIFLIAGLHRKIWIILIDSQYRHIQIITVSLFFQTLHISRSTILRHILRGIFVSIHISIGRLIQAGVSKVLTQNIAVYRDQKYQQADKHTDHHRHGRTHLPKELTDLESVKELHISQIYILYLPGPACGLFISKQRQCRALQLLADHQTVYQCGRHRRHDQTVDQQIGRSHDFHGWQGKIHDTVLHLPAGTILRKAQDTADRTS